MSLLEMKNIKKSFKRGRSSERHFSEGGKGRSPWYHRSFRLGKINPSSDVQRGLRLRMQGKSIIPEPLAGVSEF